MATHSVFLLGESHGQRSLAGYSPWGRKESVGHTHTHATLVTISCTHSLFYRAYKILSCHITLESLL